MKLSRRELPFAIPAALAGAQSTPPGGTLASKAFRFEDLAAQPSGPIIMRQIFTGTTHSGYPIDLHDTELPAVAAPHAPHHHVHEELLLIREGTLEVALGGAKTRVGPGSVVYIASNEEHGWRNAGNTPAKYFVLALGDDRA
jgi:mannose-6-phosphate isomerase-like protein (cupin superfamily)